MRRLVIVLALSACNGIAQSPECARYLACVEAISPGGSDQYASSYGESGSCWSTTRGAADECSHVCVQGRTTLSLGAGRGKPECQ